MKTPTIHFEGMFQMWAYDVSHGRLLLRKQIRESGEKRVDIVFAAVRFMQIATHFDSIRIEEVDFTEIVGKGLDSESTNEPGYRWFKIKSAGWEGYICAIAVHFHEDTCDFSELSAIYEMGPLLVKLAVNTSWYRERYASKTATSAE